MGSQYRQFILGEEFADLLKDEAPKAASPAPALNVDALGEALIVNLNAQLNLYVAYQDQAARQRMALVNRRLAENQSVNAESDRLLNQLAALETERVSVTQKLVGPHNPEAASTSVRCEAIYPLLNADQAARLKQVRDALMKALAELKHALTINQALVENGSRIIHTTVGIMTSVVGRSRGDRLNTYTAKGNVNVGRVQVRNLVNRSV